ncbi:MAG: Hint domain-containing protein [Gemmataceae bacterium]
MWDSFPTHVYAATHARPRHHSSVRVNQLVSAEQRQADGTLAVQLAYAYDADGQRIQTSRQAGNDPATVQRVAYDGDAVWADLDGLNTPTTRYLLTQEEAPAARLEGTAITAWLLTDRLAAQDQNWRKYENIEVAGSSRPPSGFLSSYQLYQNFGPGGTAETILGAAGSAFALLAGARAMRSPYKATPTGPLEVISGAATVRTSSQSRPRYLDQAPKMAPIKSTTAETEALLKEARKVCFPAGTLVSTEAGLKRIEALTPADKVWAFDHRRVEWDLRKVLQTFIHAHDGPMVTVETGDETIEATGGHPFWVVRGESLENRPLPKLIAAREQGGRQEGRWVLAKDVQKGDELLLRSGKKTEVTAVSAVDRQLLVYNIHVEELENYSVGQGGILVHNTNEIPEELAARLRSTSSQPSWTADRRAAERALNEHLARRLGSLDAPTNPNRGLTWTTERTGRPNSASAMWEDSLPGATSDVASQRRNVPALRYDNPNPAGNNHVRFDGVDPANPRVLIDRKWGVTTRTDQVDKFRSGPLEALRQNPDYRLRIEVPNQRAATDARRLLRYATGSDTHPQIDIVVVTSP